MSDKTYIETNRYSKVKDFLKKKITITGTYKVHGIDKPTGKKTTCIENIKFNNITIDHCWIITDDLANKHLRQGQSVKLVLQPIERRRPGKTFNERLLDIQFKLIQIL